MSRKDRGNIIGLPEGQERPKLAIEMRMEELEAIFKPFLEAVEEMTKPDPETGKRRELTTEDGATLAEVVDPLLSAPERIDQFVALIRNIEFREALLRGAVKSAEEKARGFAGMAKSLKDAAEQYLLNKGIKKVAGFANELALWAKPQRLEIHNEELIPESYFDTRVIFRLPLGWDDEDIENLKVRLAEDWGLEFETANRTLNKDRLIKTLEMTEPVSPGAATTKFKEVPGAEIIRNDRRLNIK